MADSKHTPGPWAVFNGVDIYPDDGDAGARRHIAVTNPDGFGPNDLTDIGFEECKANAHLIAAAPELLEALELAESYVEKAKIDGSCEYAEDALTEVRAAIARAKGES